MRTDLARRLFLGGLCSGVASLALGSSALPQRAGKKLVAMLAGGAEMIDGKSRLVEVRDGLQSLGLVDGKDFEIVARWGVGDLAKTEAFAQELVALKPDVVLTVGTAPTRAMKKFTSDIPIVFATVSDPESDGFVASLAKPGGNITGFTSFESSLATKWLDILKELSPGVARAGLLFNPETAPGGGITFLNQAEAAARKLGIKIEPQPVNDASEIARNIDTLANGSASGLFIVPSSFTSFNARTIVDSAARHRIPAVYPFRNFVVAGGLMSYGFDISDQVRQSTVYLDRILRGESPKDLPVQAPNKFSLVLNMKTARAQGLNVPLTLQVAADEVIE